MKREIVRSRTLLQASAAPSLPPTVPPTAFSILTILATLLGALASAIGIALLAWYIHRRRRTVEEKTSKGVEKKLLDSFPILTFDHRFPLLECPICLAEFAQGEKLRLLPPCGHAFHSNCADRWLAAHSCCPLCRFILVDYSDAKTIKGCKLETRLGVNLSCSG